MIRRRSGWVSVALVALAVVAAGAALAKDRDAPKRRTTMKGAAAESTEVLLRIGVETITRGDVQRRLDELPEHLRSGAATPDGRQQLLDRMVEEKVWLMAALKNGVADRPRVRAQLEDQRRNLVIRTWIQDVMAGNPAPSDSQARVYYDAHQSEYIVPATVTARHIQTRTQADARKVMASLKAGGDFVKLAKLWSTDSLTRNNGGLLGAVTRDGQLATLGRQPALAESVFTLAARNVGGPWKGDKGWHVVKADEVTPEATRPFEQMRPMILRQLGTEGQRSFYNAKLDSIRRALGVTSDSAAIRKFVSQKKGAREMFQDAQARGPATERLDAYQSLLREYPDSDVAPQAQFMVGFIFSEELRNYDEAEKSFRRVLERYPKSELAASAKWMVEHMRSEDAPSFAPTEADSNPPARAVRNPSGKP
jgi:peptidyl-prolyl cis-trans isomerase C